MAFNVFDNSGQAFYFVFLIITGVVGFGALVLRFVASKVANRKLGLEDILATAAVLVFLTRTSCGLREDAIEALIIINGRYLDLAFDPKAYEASFKVIFVADIITMLDQTLSKWSVCALYLRIFRVMSTYRKWIYALAIAQGLCYIGLVIMQTLQCRPVNRFWQYWVDGECFPFAWILLALEIPNSLIDFALVALAMVMVKGIQLQSRSMWKLRLLFRLGTFAGIFGFIKIGLAYNPNTPYTTAVIGLWAALQSTACIICCCAPVCGRLFSEWGLWSRLTLRASDLSSYIRGIKIGGTSTADRSNKTMEMDKTMTYTHTRIGSADSHQKPAQSHRWIRPNVSSTDRLVTRQSTERNHGQPFPLGTIHVDRSYDVVRETHYGRLQERF